MTIKMNKIVVFVLTMNLKVGFMYRYEKPIAQSIWTQPCDKNSMILNDCNWCRCVQSRYTCDARVCKDVDMFGHFNDAIRDLNVGMEGHGVWRTNQLLCDPGIHYQRDSLLCICNEDGTWPNPVCRDTFRILHPVEPVTDFQIFKKSQCEPAKLYLIGCNVCFCPADSIPNPKFCTTNICPDNDPVFSLDTPKATNELSEVYVQCELNTIYQLGCKSCTCLKNNRLLCGNCSDTASEDSRSGENICKNRKPGEIFHVDCNSCQCDSLGLIYCTAKSCIQRYTKMEDNFDEKEFKIVEAPLNDIDCVVGTKYKKGCNTCYCFEGLKGKKFGCTLDSCSNRDTIHDSCVEGFTYDKNCLVCQCANYKGKQMEICGENPKCKKYEVKTTEVNNWVGYCEPMRQFMKGCDPCECLPDGKTIRCLPSHCPEIKENRISSQKEDIRKPIAVEVVPVVRDIGTCENGAIFKIDCNLCLCLSNNDVICTTEDCGRRYLVRRNN